MASKKEKKDKDPNAAVETRVVNAEVLKFSSAKKFTLPKDGIITVDGKKLKLTQSAVASLAAVKEHAGDKEGAETCRAWLKAKSKRKGAAEPIKEGSECEYKATWTNYHGGFRNVTIPVGLLFPEGEQLKEGRILATYKKDQIIITRKNESKKPT